MTDDGGLDIIGIGLADSKGVRRGVVVNLEAAVESIKKAIDEQDGIGAPVGMTGTRLEVNVHVVTGSASSTQNIVACVNRAGVAVLDTVLEQLAASESVLTDDEKQLGVAIVDIGGGTTDF